MILWGFCPVALLKEMRSSLQQKKIKHKAESKDGEL
jgi:hypothetical protein